MSDSGFGVEARRRAGIVIALVAVGVVALFVRGWEIGEKSLWLDEAWSWRAARLSLPAMVEWTGQDKHPPLYYGVLHVWVKLFGDSEASLRMPSAIAGAVAAVVLAGAGWRAGGAMLGLAASGLLALQPTAVEFAQEARMYSLEGLWAVASSVALAAMIDRPAPARAALYAGLALGAVYTHYSGFLLLGVQALLIAGYGAWRWRVDGDVRMLLAGAAALGVVLAGYAPWYGNMIESAREGVGHLPEPGWRLADVVFSALLGLQRASDFWLAIALPGMGLGLWGVWRKRREPYAVCVAAIALVPVLQLMYSIVRSPVFDARQTSPYVAGYVFVLAVGLVELGSYAADVLQRRWLSLPVTVAGGAGLAALALAASADWYGRGPREDWRAAAAAIDGVQGPVYVWRGYIDEPLRYYSEASFTAISPEGRLLVAADSGAPAALVLSHQTPDEERAILRNLSGPYVVGEPRTYVGIAVYELLRR
jgi:uncharacterized membrane protein